MAREGKAAYVAGFPKTSAALNRSIYNFTDGRITANASRPLDDGYALVYSNNTLPGMSGGPVLNENGEVVGIHGRADTRAAESSSINQDIQIAKTGFNLGIPINTSLRLLASSQVDLGVNVPSAPVATGPKADDFYIQGGDKSQKGDYQGAIAAYSQALVLNPNYAEAYNNRGITRSDLGDKKGAIADYNEALRINPNSAEAYYNRGNARFNLGDKEGAIQDYQKAANLYQQEGNTNDYQDAINRIRELERNSPTRSTSTTLLSANSSLIPGKSSVLPSDGSLYEQHTFVGRAGQSVTISVESRDFDTLVALFSPDAKLLVKNDDISRSNTNSALTFTLPASGRYTVVVNAYKKGERGRYTLTIR